MAGDTTQIAKEPTATPDRVAWDKWREAPSASSMGAVVTALSPVIEEAAKANPTLSPSMMRSQARGYAVKAIKSYDPNAGASLTTHVRNYMKPITVRGHQQASAVPKGRHVEETRGEYRRSFEDFVEEKGREPTSSEMARRLKIPLNRASALMAEVGRYEMAEGAIEGSVDAGGGEDPAEVWFNYLYHDLAPRDQLIIDHKLGTHGKEKLGLADAARRANVSTSMAHKVVSRFANQLIKESGHGG